jgi:hypothetical protein
LNSTFRNRWCMYVSICVRVLSCMSNYVKDTICICFVCLFFFVIYIHVLYIRDFAQSFVYLSMFDLKNKIETYILYNMFVIWFELCFPLCFFFLPSFSFICIVPLVILLWQEFINRKLQIINRFIVLFCFCFLDKCHQDSQQLLQRLKYLRKYVIEEHSKFCVTIIISMNIKQ